MGELEIPITTQLATEGALSEEEMAALQTARKKPALVANIIRGWLAEEG
jgi:flagellar biosynthesis/type III secretory pathway M-ring protein FliF/YscJ